MRPWYHPNHAGSTSKRKAKPVLVTPRDRSTPWAAKGRVAGPALLERGLELIEETLGPLDIL